MKVSIIIYSLILLSGLSAQEGKTIYQTYCAACHGANGEGRKGAAPALAQSSWVNGDPNIISKILLHGLQGSMSMHGESFELVMPAQTLLSDKQMADVASFVRSQWGNKAAPISEDFFRKTREETKSQSGVINSMHFIKPYKLKDYTFKVENLLSSSFPFTIDFDSLSKKTPKSIEEEQGGLLDPLQAGSEKESFTAKWTGLLKIDKAGEYNFSFGTDNAARISIDGKVVLERSKGMVPSVGSIKLNKGEVEVDVYYAHEAVDSSFFRLFISSSDMNMYRLHNNLKKKKQPPITINPTESRALVHRNFLVKGGERTLAVGFPQNINCYFSTKEMRLSKVWNGEFLDVGATWSGRARGKLARPLGRVISVVEKGEIFKVSSSEIKHWEDKNFTSVEKQFNGYEFDADGDPKFTYTVGGYSFSDHFSIEKGTHSFIREITIEPGDKSTKGLHWKLLENAEKINDTSFKTREGLVLNVLSDSSLPSLLGEEVVIKITQPITITLEYVWK